MNEIYLVDAINFLFRSYYAIGPMTNQKGQSTSALYGFIRTLQKILKEKKPEHLVTIFDGPDNKASRRAVYAEYKAHRKAAPEDLFPQFEWAEQFCKLAGIPTLCIPGAEADDAIASVARWAEKKGANVFICSSDKDLMQLVNDHVKMFLPHKDNLLVGPKEVEELMGVRPDQIIDYLAIMGDASDNVPGLEGFGPKTASSLLQQFGTLDEILAHPEKVPGEKKQQTLREHKKIALMSRELVTLVHNIDIPHSEKTYHLAPPNRDELASFYQEMNFKTLLRDLGEAQPQAKPKRHIEKHEYHLVDTPIELQLLVDQLKAAKEFCLDVETTALHPMTAELVGLGFCIHPGTAWYVPCNGELGLQEIVATFKPLLAKAHVYGHNIKYDAQVLANYDIELSHIVFDTLLASYILHPDSRQHNLDALALEHFQKVKIPIEDLLGKGKKTRTMREVPIASVKEYCCEDADYTARLKEIFEEELREKKLTALLQDLELPLLPVLARMEREGIYLDVERLATVGHKLTHELSALTKKIFHEVGSEFNLNSPKQLSDILYNKLKLPQPKRKKTEFATGADVLEDLAHESPVVQHILTYRVLEKLRTTYVESLPQTINPKTDRIHCTFSQSTAATGRLACSDPNLQNIPVRSPEGLEIRACFKPQKRGWSYVGADYSQIELRLLAHFCEDADLIHAFKSGQDIHVHTASKVFGVPASQVTPDMRSRAKTVNFGILYGQGPFGLSQQLGISHREASQFIEAYFAQYPLVRTYLEHCKEQARKTGVARTLNGRQRPIPELHNRNPAIRAAAERLAVNTPLQGTAADLIKQAMLDIDAAIRKAEVKGRMILQIHDELIFEVPDDEVTYFKRLAKEKMEGVLHLKVPLEAHIAVGKNWAEC